MSSHQKTPFVRNLNAWGEQKAFDEIVKSGLALPGVVAAVSGAIVTINFQVQGVTLPQVTMPLAGPEYLRFPIKPGDKGVAIPASVFLGGVSGLGGGTADLTQRANLATLFWVPLGNTAWTPVTPGYTVMYGPNDVIIQDTATATPTTFVKVTAGQISMAAGGHTILINAAGVTIDGKVFLTHGHVPGTYVAGATPVTGASGAVV